MNALDTRKAIQGILGVTQDGEIGPITIAALDSASSDAVRQVQADLHVAQDGIIGPKSMQTLGLLCSAPDDSTWPGVPEPTGNSGDHAVLASDFADPSDKRAWDRCKSEGKSDQSCFAVGDNCVGAWGKSTESGTGPCCALPPEEWSQFGKNPSGKLVHILNPANGRTVTGDLRDTMPHIPHITNGCRIDLNPDAVAALGLTIPVKNPVVWRWA